MIAILYSGAARWRRLLLGLVLGFAIPVLRLPADPSFADLAKQSYLTNRTRFQLQQTNAAIAADFARSCFEWAEYARNDDEREHVAREGIEAARRCVKWQPALASGHYYLAMNLGQLARTKSLGALKLIGEMEREFKRAGELDEDIDYAGPDRSLGLLYLQAPGWPASVGSRSKARIHLRRAVELSPDFPENHLCLLEAYLKWDERKNAIEAAKALRDLWPRAKSSFTGIAWAAAWLDWEQRWSSVQSTLNLKHGEKR